MNIINRKLNTFSLYLGKDAKSETNKLIVAPIKIHSPIFLAASANFKDRIYSKITEKSGTLVGVKAVGIDDELMLITTEGIIIRIHVADTALLGRVTSGVKLINLSDDVTVASIAKVREDKSLIANEEEQDEASSENMDSENPEK